MDDRLTQLQGSLEHHNSSFSTAIETISTNTCRLAEETSALSARVVEHQSHQIGVQDMMMVYMLPDPYHDAFEQTVDLWKFDLTKHATSGLSSTREMVGYISLQLLLVPLRRASMDGGLGSGGHGLSRLVIL